MKRAVDTDAAPKCRVCVSGPLSLFAMIDGVRYNQCADCGAVLMAPEDHPDPATELERYRLHQNDPSDAGYRAFLGRLAGPLVARLAPNREGLDVGCGPGPALAHMLREAGHRVRLYDPFFYPDTEALEQTYDFIACTETAEHFHLPAREFERLGALLRPGGWLGLMTSFLTDEIDFAAWHYRRDCTHVVFYRPRTLHRLARRFEWRCEIPAPNIALFFNEKGLAPGPIQPTVDA